jgi:hypothetical protein
MMTSNRSLEDWGKLIGDVPSATAILDRCLHHAEIIAITGRSYRLRNQARSDTAAEDSSEPQDSKPADHPSGGARPAGSPAGNRRKKAATTSAETCQS